MWNSEGSASIQDESKSAFAFASADEASHKDSILVRHRHAVKGGNVWVDINRDPEEIKAQESQDDGKSILHKSTEAQQLMIHFHDILDLVDKQTPRRESIVPHQRERPLLKYFHRTVRKVIAQLQRSIFQEKLQHLIFDMLILNDGKTTAKKNSWVPREELVKSVSDTSSYWDTLALAQSNTAKTFKGHNIIPTRPDEEEGGSDNDDVPLEHAKQSPRHPHLQTLSPRRWPTSLRRLGGVTTRSPTPEGFSVPRFSAYLNHLIEDQEDRSNHPSRPLSVSEAFPSSNRKPSNMGTAVSPQADSSRKEKGGSISGSLRAGSKSKFQDTVAKVGRVSSVLGQLHKRITSKQYSMGTSTSASAPVTSPNLARTRNQFQNGSPGLNDPVSESDLGRRSSAFNDLSQGNSGARSRVTRGKERSASVLTGSVPSSLSTIRSRRQSTNAPNLHASDNLMNEPRPKTSPAVTTSGLEGVSPLPGQEAGSAFSDAPIDNPGMQWSRTTTPSRLGAPREPLRDLAAWALRDRDKTTLEKASSNQDSRAGTSLSLFSLCPSSNEAMGFGLESLLSSRCESRSRLQDTGEQGFNMTSNHVERAAEVRYFRQCNRLGVLPTNVTSLMTQTQKGTSDDKSQMFSHNGSNPRQSVTLGRGVQADSEPATVLNFRAKVLSGGCKLQALASMIPALHDIALIDISHNQLDDASIASLLSCLHRVAQSRRQVFASLTTMVLGHNRLGAKSVKALRQVVLEDVLPVRGVRIALSGIQLSQDLFDEVCNIFCRRRGLDAVDFSDMGLGRFHQTPCKRVVELISGCRQLRELQIGYNHFREEGLRILAGVVGSEKCRLTFLSLAENGCAAVHGAGLKDTSERNLPHPMLYFIEQLRMNKELTELDFSRCMLHQEGAICLEDSLRCHPQLATLHLSGNPLGEAGIRAILRLVISKSSQINWTDVAHVSESSCLSDVEFNYGDLTEEFTGNKALHLSNPYHRAVLRLLISRAADCGKTPQKVFLQCSYNNGPFKFDNMKKDSSGDFILPKTGELQFVFSAKTDHLACSTPQEFFDDWKGARRIPVNLSKFVSVVAMWRQLKSETEQTMFIGAMSKDLLLRLGQMKLFVEKIAQSRPSLVPQVVMQLMQTLPDADRMNVNSLLRMSITTKAGHKVKLLGEREKNTMARTFGKMSTTNFANPTGRFKNLALERPSDYATAEQILALSAWEAAIARDRGEVDVSQTQPYSAIRNFSFNGEKFSYKASWVLPGDGFIGEGTISLDYITPIRARGEPLESASFFRILNYLKSFDEEHIPEECSWEALRMVSHRFYVDAEQLKLLVQQFEEPSYKMDTYCTFFARCTEFGAPLNNRRNGLLGTCFNAFENKVLQERLGNCVTFDSDNFHTKGFDRFELNLAWRDERIIAAFLMEMSQVEPGVNMVDTMWSEASPDQHNRGWFVPAYWVTNMPYYGIFTLKYVCEPHYVFAEQRRVLSQKYFGWTTTEPAPEETSTARKSVKN